MSKLAYNFTERLEADAAAWDSVVTDNSYWSSDYMNTLNEVPPSGVKSHFCLVTHEGKPVAKFLFQYLTIRLSESFGDPSGEQKKQSFFKALIKKIILPFLNFKIVVNGNLLLSGSYGFKYKAGLNFQTKQSIFDQAIKAYQEYLKANNLKASGILLKDLDNPNHTLDIYLSEQDYTHFKVQPKMKFEVPADWSTMDDYKAALKSKYRIRYNKTKKSLANIEKRRLSSSDIAKYKDDMYQLYLQTVGKAGFNLFLLDQDYFLNLTNKMPDRFVVDGLFDGDKMVAFFTLMDNGEEYDAHYLGYNLELNHQYKLYHNMLFFMVEDAIVGNKKRLHMSRTALEIKSSVGTVPEEVQLYAKYFSKIGNWFLPRILDITVPKLDWQERSPFK